MTSPEELINDRLRRLAAQLLATQPIAVGEWHAQDVSASRMHDTHELLDVTVRISGTTPILALEQMIGANTTWVREHFLERVGGLPVNPAPSHERWPWSRHNGQHQQNEKFSHTYPERMWPKHAGDCHGPYGWAAAGLDGVHGEMVALDPYGHDGEQQICPGHRGIRYRYGDLEDVVNLMARSPFTRQAYLPIWFPEDTGAVASQRVPCSLGYHFLIRNGRLSCRYSIRSCDFVRHFSDDLLLAVLLTEWMVLRLRTMAPEDSTLRTLVRGDLLMQITSLHALRGDKATLERWSR